MHSYFKVGSSHFLLFFVIHKLIVLISFQVYVRFKLNKKKKNIQ